MQALHFCMAFDRTITEMMFQSHSEGNSDEQLLLPSKALVLASSSCNHNWRVREGKCNFYYSNTWLMRRLFLFELDSFCENFGGSQTHRSKLFKCQTWIRQIGSLNSNDGEGNAKQIKKLHFSDWCRVPTHALRAHKQVFCAKRHVLRRQVHNECGATPETHLSPCTVITFGDKIMILEPEPQSECL